MKIQIRRGVFETNSSSTHALCIAKKHTSIIEHIDFGKLNNQEFWSAKKDYQYRADMVFAAIIGKYDYDCAKAFSRLGKLIKLLDVSNISYSFNFDEEYIENDLPYVDGELDWIDTVLENEENLLNFIFSDRSCYVTEDRDEVYKAGGWKNIVDTEKCNVYV